MSERRDTCPGIQRWALPAILALAALLRLWSIDFGLPFLEARPDEMEVVPRALRLLSGDLNPHFFYYPSLYFYLLGSVFTGAAAVAALGGTPLEDFLAQGILEPQGFILAARVVSALAGIATVYVAYLVGKRLQDVRTGLLAAGFLAVCHLHVRDSHFATTDVTLTLFILLSTYFLLGVGSEGRWKDYLAAGVCAGLAISTKYVGLVVFGGLAVAHLVHLHHREVEGGWLGWGRQVFVHPGPWVFLLGSVAAFVATSPFALLDWDLFMSHFRFQMGHLATGHGVDLGIGGVYHLLNTFPKGLGWPLFLASVGGAAWALRRRPAPTLVLLSFPLLFYLSTFTGRTLFLRYMLPVFPFLCVTGAWMVRTFLPFREKTWPWTTLVVLGLVAVPLWEVVGTNVRLGREDTRVQGGRWLEDAAAGGVTSVLQTGERWGWLDLPLTTDSLKMLLEAARRPLGPNSLKTVRRYAEMGARARLEEGLRRGGGFRQVSYDPAAGFGEESPPEWIVVLESPLQQYSIVPEGLPGILEERYVEAARFGSSTPGASGWYDQHDSFYLPFKGVRSVTRPGPEVTIFRRIPSRSPDG